MNVKKNLEDIKENIFAVINRDTPLGQSLWQILIEMHPADVADLLEEVDDLQAEQLFVSLSEQLKREVFNELSDSTKATLLEGLNDKQKVDLLNSLSPDELTDIFDHLTDEVLKKYLNLLHKSMREQVLSLLQFDHDSAGGIMTTDVVTLTEDFTVEQSIKLLQRLRPSKDIHHQIFVTDASHILVGHINLEDLVLQHPKARINTFMHKNELIARPNEDQETIAKQMVHYGLMIVPVADNQNTFLGVIESETLVGVLVEEAGEDVTRMASLPATRFPYFEMSFARLLYLRGYVLLALLIAESFSGSIIRASEATMTGILISFIPMLTSAGGNTGSQTSAVVIQGMASGDIGFFNMFRFLRREFCVSITIAAVMGIVSFIRSYFVGATILECFTISGSLSLIVFISAMLGSFIPFLLRRINIDPAFSAGPFLATLMDILGIVIYCYMSKLILFPA